MTRWQFKYEELEKKHRKLVNYLVGYRDQVATRRDEKADALFILNRILENNEL